VEVDTNIPSRLSRDHPDYNSILDWEETVDTNNIPTNTE